MRPVLRRRIHLAMSMQQARVIASRARSAAASVSEQNTVMRLLWQAPAQRRERGAAFAAVAPDRHLLAFKLRNSHAAAPTASGRNAVFFRRDQQRRHVASSPASSCGRISRAKRCTSASSRQLGLSARAAMAARDSLPSPTHSNGLWSWYSSSASKPGACSASSSRLRPKMAIRRGFGMNGARARNTKWHFGQTPHQRCAGRSPRMWKLRLQLEKCAS